ncbi:MAG: AAA family ATPase [Flammeovirgaceae bacterium]|nr:AAA family ATPase [Flammeovirgaceae bacterium]
MGKQLEKKYKFKDLKVYSSTEWLAEGNKKYRKVFENTETTYLYAELSFFNKLFDEEDWKVAINLKCYRYNGTSKESVCNLDIEKEVETDENIVFVREGWGHEEPGHIWKRGDYLWEAYIDEELVGTTYFYIENGGPVTLYDNPYFEINSIKLYEGPKSGVENSKRKFLKQFQDKDTRYVWVEFNLENAQDRAWFCELNFNFYNDAGQLKGSTSELKQIKSSENEITIITGWGSDNKGSWYHDKYKLEIVFMDHLIAVVPFDCGNSIVEGINKFLHGEDLILKPNINEDDSSNTSSIEDTLIQLETLVALSDIKNRVRDYINYLEFLKLRQSQGFDENEQINLHSIFTGNPGTGKTTVARLLGKLYHQMGLLSEGTFLEVGRAELIGQYIGQTAPKVKDVIDSARGGVLFIDEAYALVRNIDDDKDYGHEVIEVLVKEMSDGPGDIAIFVAGYPSEMDNFINSNPGLKSRFNMHFNFNDYLPQELIEISKKISHEKNVTFTKSAKKLLYKELTEAFRARDRAFGNARLVVGLINDAKMEMGLRVMNDYTADEEINKTKLRTIRKEDLEKVFQKNESELPFIDVDKEALEEALIELRELIGLSHVKAKIDELIALVKFYKETGKDIIGNFNLHTVFKGNPGTGKTTVARILAKIYKALGILERGHVVECSRQDLVAGFVGQTALKSKGVIDQAKGGVLFIDEAYSLMSGHQQNDFGKEAIEVILKEMEDDRGRFIVIAAGYTGEMEKLLETNPGLKSRFDVELTFEDYSYKELYQVALFMLEKEGLKPNKEAELSLLKYLEFIYNNRDKYFGNARAVRKMADKAVKNQHLRMAGLKAKERTKYQLRTLSLDDVKEFNQDNKELSNVGRKIGF